MNAIDRQHLNEVAADEAHDIGLVKRDALRSALAELDRLEGSFRLAVRRKQETQAEADRQRTRAEAHAIVNAELHEMIRELRAKLDGNFSAQVASIESAPPADWFHEAKSILSPIK